MSSPADRPGSAAGGWSWFAEPDRRSDPSADALARAFARCFSRGEGETVLASLDGMTLGRTLGPEASEAALRHLEGQRHLIAYIHGMIDRGRGLN